MDNFLEKACMYLCNLYAYAYDREREVAQSYSGYAIDNAANIANNHRRSSEDIYNHHSNLSPSLYDVIWNDSHPCIRKGAQLKSHNGDDMNP
jgi:hypothetical protein